MSTAFKTIVYLFFHVIMSVINDTPGDELSKRSGSVELIGKSDVIRQTNYKNYTSHIFKR